MLMVLLLSTFAPKMSTFAPAGSCSQGGVRAVEPRPANASAASLIHSEVPMMSAESHQQESSRPAWDPAEALAVCRQVIAQIASSGEVDDVHLMIWEGICSRVDAASEARDLKALRAAAEDFWRSERTRATKNDHGAAIDSPGAAGSTLPSAPGLFEAALKTEAPGERVGKPIQADGRSGI